MMSQHSEELIAELLDRAASYRLGGPSSEHTARLLEEAADRIATLSEAAKPAPGGPKMREVKLIIAIGDHGIASAECEDTQEGREALDARLTVHDGGRIYCAPTKIEHHAVTILLPAPAVPDPVPLERVEGERE